MINFYLLQFPIKKEPLSPTYLTRSMDRKRPHFLRSPKSKSTEVRIFSHKSSLNEMKVHFPFKMFVQ